MPAVKSGSGLNMSRRIRRSPYTDRVEQHGVRGFTVVNHMLLPKAFQPGVEEDYWHLREHVQIWDVATQRQVSISGRDAAQLMQWMTPRDISGARVGQCLYVPLVDDRGGMVNDPVLLKLADDHFWLSIADSDVLLWARGLALGRGYNVEITEPDVAPLAVQGPKAEDLMVALFGPAIRDVGFFEFGQFDVLNTKQIIARSGYSKQGGFEIYLEGGHLGSDLWDLIWQAGQAFNIAPGCPNLIERIEGGLLSYGNEFTLDNNPLECGLSTYCSIDGSVDHIGLEALQAINKAGVERLMRGIEFDGAACAAVASPLPVRVGDWQVGQITSGIWSPRKQCNVGLSMIDRGYWDAGQAITVDVAPSDSRTGHIRLLPFD